MSTAAPAPAAEQTRAPARRRGAGRTSLMWWLLALVIGVWCLFPLFSIFATSFKAPSDLANGRLLPTQWSTVNYEEIFVGGSRDLFLTALRNSVGITVIATLIAVALATLPRAASSSTIWPPRELPTTWGLSSPTASKNSSSCSALEAIEYPWGLAGFGDRP